MVEGDVLATELILMMNEILEKNPGALCFVKWTCPNCGKRAVSDAPNTFHKKGYIHEDCGYHYTGERYGLLVMLGEDLRKVLDQWSRFVNEDRERQ